MLMEYTRLNPTKEIPDLRVMDFSSIKSDTGFTIATVYSDSTLRYGSLILILGSTCSSLGFTLHAVY